METTRAERLKAVISPSAIKLPQRPGIHSEAHQAVAALLGMYGLDRANAQLH